MRCQEGPVRVLIVDDDPVYRQILVRCLSQIENAKVIGTAGTIAEAKQRLSAGNIDMVTLDVVLRDESGLDLLAWISKEHRNVLVALLTSGDERRASQTIDSILLGAMSLVLKPSGPQAPAILQKALATLINNVCPPKPKQTVAAAKRQSLDPLALMPRERELIAIGASTGGPPVLLQMLRSLPAAFDVPIVLTQHMLPEHLHQFRDMLSFVDGRKVHLAEQGAPLTPHGVFIAPPNKHLGVARQATGLVVNLLDGPPENYCKPAVDPMFRSVADVCGRGAMGVILTGMGSDGAKGAVALQAGGAPIVVQDEASSVVWAMPGAAVAAGAASEVVPATDIAKAIVRLTIGRATGKVGPRR